jgi:hypothetical protein
MTTMVKDFGAVGVPNPSPSRSFWVGRFIQNKWPLFGDRCNGWNGEGFCRKALFAVKHQVLRPFVECGTSLSWCNCAAVTLHQVPEHAHLCALLAMKLHRPSCLAVLGFQGLPTGCRQTARHSFRVFGRRHNEHLPLATQMARIQTCEPTSTICPKPSKKSWRA